MAPPEQMTGKAKRRLSFVLAKITLLLALILGAISGAIQIWVDLRQEKDAVQYSAEEFLISVTPSAASAAYNFYFPAADRVVEGLFSQRAIVSVTIVNEGEVMIFREREANPTLPNLGRITITDPVVLEQPLLAPQASGQREEIGKISITVDRSIVAPAFVNRMLFYFLFASVKNALLGILLILIVYGVLATHIVRLTEVTGLWQPESGPLESPRAPALLKGTELDMLGEQIKRLAMTAMGRINEVVAHHEAAVQSNTELSQKSEHLSKAVQEQNRQLQRANARLKEMAEFDALTNLYNRGFFDRMAAEVYPKPDAEPQACAVLLIDVDYFKSYNDHYGHQAGDTCLAQVAKIVRSVLDVDGALVARYGGEEFVALIVGPAARGIDDLAKAIHDRLAARPIEHQRSMVAERITVSIGLASKDEATTTEQISLHQLISSADEALYEAKDRGRNQSVRSSTELRNRVREARMQAHRLLKAIEARAFEPFFQAQVDAAKGEMIGVEALVRWRGDDGTYASPDAFFHVAQVNGYLPLIDQIVLDHASDFLEQAKCRGTPIPRLALNMPRENLLDRRYMDNLVELARSSETQIVVELLETTMLDSPDDVLMWQLDRLRQENIDIEIDDFGTGHTSIVSLMTLRPSRLKIAKELVIPMKSNTAYEDIVSSIIKMSEALGIGVLAEGVEDAKVSARLMQMGCPLQQGFLFSRPMPASDFFEAQGTFAENASMGA